MPLTMHRLVYDTSSSDTRAESANVGAHVLAGTDGTAIGHTGDALHVNIQNASIGVSATDLDIRDLVNTQDSIAIGDSSTIVDIVTEDISATGGENGFFIMGVRQDAAGSPVSADGDYHGLVFNADGELKVAADLTSSVADDAPDSGNPIKVGGRAFDTSSTMDAADEGDRVDLLTDQYRRQWMNDSYNVGWTTTSATVTSAAAQIDGTKQAGRQAVDVQNLGNRAIYIGPTSSVTTSTGLAIPPQDTYSQRLGEFQNIFAISNGGSQQARIAQYA